MSQFLWFTEITAANKSKISKLSVESLENRLVPAPLISFDVASRSIIISGSEGNDSAEVRQQGSSILVSITSRSGRVTRSMSNSQVSHIVFNGRSGDDLFNNLTAIPSCADGGAGHDILRGGRAADSLVGGAGNDQLFGGQGNDTLDGGNGNDSAWGGAGNDRLMGGDGQDRIFGEDGSDDIWAGIGNDMTDGGAGNDSIRGEDGNDTIAGGSGNDLIDGGNGADDLLGGAGNDSLNGEKGDDQLNGELGTDQLVGGEGLDTESDPQDRFSDGDNDGDGFDNDYDFMDILYSNGNQSAYADDAFAASIIATVSSEVRNYLKIAASDSGLKVRVASNPFGEWVTGTWRYLTTDKIQVWGKWAYPASDPSQLKTFVQYNYNGPRNIGSAELIDEFSNPANYSISPENRFYAWSTKGPVGQVFLSWLGDSPVSFYLLAPSQQGTGFPIPTIEALKTELGSISNLTISGDWISGDLGASTAFPGVQPVVDLLRTVNRLSRASNFRN